MASMISRGTAVVRSPKLRELGVRSVDKALLPMVAEYDSARVPTDAEYDAALHRNAPKERFLLSSAMVTNTRSRSEAGVDLVHRQSASNRSYRGRKRAGENTHAATMSAASALDGAPVRGVPPLTHSLYDTARPVLSLWGKSGATARCS